MAEIKKAKPGRAQLFAAADIDVDSDGETLVIEFPTEQAFSVQLAEEPDARELLQRSLAIVLGFAPPVRYQLGKGSPQAAASHPEAADPQSAAPPAPEPAPAREPAPGPAPAPEPEPREPELAPAPEPASPPQAARPAAPSAVPQDDITRLLTEGLGAQIIAEKPAGGAADTDDPGSEGGDPRADSVPVQDGPGLFDIDPREDEES
jgi:hypothetical protein